MMDFARIIRFKWTMQEIKTHSSIRSIIDTKAKLGISPSITNSKCDPRQFWMWD